MFRDRHEAERYFRSLVGILPDDPERPLIILEGPSDKDALAGVLRGNLVSVIDTNRFPDPHLVVDNNKKAVLAFAKWLKNTENRTAFIGIVDADTERIEELLKNPDQKGSSTPTEIDRLDVHVFTTDDHDLDVHVICETIMDFMRERLRGRKYEEFVYDIAGSSRNYHTLLWRLIVKAAYEIGLVRLALHQTYVSQRHIGKRVSDTKYIAKNLTVNSEAIFDDAVYDRNSPSLARTRYEEIKDVLEEELGISNVWRHLVNGHDLLRILGFCILECQGNNALGFAEHGVPNALRKMYDMSRFSRTELYQRIKRWADGKLRLFYSGS